MYGNISLELKNDYDKLENIVKNLKIENILNNFDLDYKEPTIDDLKELYKISNNFTDQEKINIGKKYDNIDNHFIKLYYKFNKYNSITHKQIIQDMNILTTICNYFILKYKIDINAARPFQLANKYSMPLYPVNLPTTTSGSFPSGHTGLYYAFYLYFSNLDFKNTDKYFKLYYNGAMSRIIAGIHFKQDNEASIKLINEIFKLIIYK